MPAPQALVALGCRGRLGLDSGQVVAAATARKARPEIPCMAGCGRDGAAVRRSAEPRAGAPHQISAQPRTRSPSRLPPAISMRPRLAGPCPKGYLEVADSADSPCRADREAWGLGPQSPTRRWRSSRHATAEVDVPAPSTAGHFGAIRDPELPQAFCSGATALDTAADRGIVDRIGAEAERKR